MHGAVLLTSTDLPIAVLAPHVFQVGRARRHDHPKKFMFDLEARVCSIMVANGKLTGSNRPIRAEELHLNEYLLLGGGRDGLSVWKWVDIDLCRRGRTVGHA